MADPLRVLEVVPYYAPAWVYGGPPKVMSAEAVELVRRGHDVEVFTTDALDGHGRVEGAEIQVEDGVRVHRFRNLSNWLAYHQYRFQPRGMRRALRQIDVDVVHLSETRHELAILAWREARRRRLPLVVSAHGTLPRRGGVKGRIRVAYDAVWVTPMLQAAAALFAQTTHEAAGYVEFDVDPERVHLVPLGVDSPPEPAPGPEPDIDLGVPDGAPIILFLGRIHPLKGVDRLLRAFAEIAGRHPDAWLVVAGRDDGALESNRQLARQLGIDRRTRFTGPIYGEDRYRAYRRASLFAITPTHYEETSLASLEAASVGTPLVVTAEAEVPFMAEYGAGWSTSPGDEVAPLLDTALNADLEVAGTAARRMIDERHRWDVVVSQVETIFDRVRR